MNDANSWGADYFISLHTNASDVTSASGSEAFVYRRDSDAEYLAENILTQLNYATGLQNRGVMVRPGLYVLKKTRMPATLVELGFITNPVERRAYGIFSWTLRGGSIKRCSRLFRYALILF